MFFDPSAMVAILKTEPGHDGLIDRMEGATTLITSDFVVVETVLALH